MFPKTPESLEAILDQDADGVMAGFHATGIACRIYWKDGEEIRFHDMPDPMRVNLAVRGGRVIGAFLG